MKKFVISAESFGIDIGGLKVLHKLCHMLNVHGYEAYIAPSAPGTTGKSNGRLDNFLVFKNYHTPLIDIRSLHPNEYIAIYPEAWFGNHMNAKNIVRWILGPPGKDQINSWGKEDMWFWYQDLYHQDIWPNSNLYKDKNNSLSIIEFHRDLFFNENTPRNFSSWMLRKAQDYKDELTLIHPQDSVFLPFHVGADPNRLRQIFNQCHTFYCYDIYTFVSVQAAMCGTLSIVVPKQGIEAPKYRSFHKLNKYLAYGLDDIDRASSIKDSLPKEIDDIEKNMLSDLHIFVEKCNEKFR